MEPILRFNDDLAVVHAYLCADGYVCKTGKDLKAGRLGLRNTCPELLFDFQERFKRYFTFEPHIYDGRCAIHCKTAWTFLINNFNSFHSYEWIFPNGMNEKQTCLWLRAFFDCESWITKRAAKDRSVSLECVNEKGIYSVQKALNELQIKSTISKRKTRPIYVLRICQKEMIVKFKNKIGFLHPQKKAALDESLNTYISYEWKFPKETNALNEFVIAKLIEKVKVNKMGQIKFCSNTKSNLVKLSKYLFELFKIDSKVYGPRYNGLGTKFFQLEINKKSEVEKALKYCSNAKS